MNELPSGPKGDRLREFMTRQMERHWAKVMARRPVFGLLQPDLEGVLGASNGESVTLAYGDPLEPAGPYVQVRTFFPPAGSGQDGMALDEDVARLMPEEHRRLGDQANWADLSAERRRRSVAKLRVGEVLVDVQAMTGAGVVVARAEPSRASASDRPVQVSVVARGVALEGLQIGTVEDLQPFWDRRGAWLARLATAHEADEAAVFELPTPSGFAALRALVDSSIEHADRIRQSNGQVPLRSSRRDGMIRGRLWDAAIEAQSHLSDQSHNTAAQAVTSMVNHLTTASLHLAWFADRDLRERAVNETIGFAVFGATVPSAPAQAAWSRWWESRSITPAEQLDRLESAERGEPVNDPEAVRERFRQLDAHERVWRDAWSAWVD